MDILNESYRALEDTKQRMSSRANRGRTQLNEAIVKGAQRLSSGSNKNTRTQRRKRRH